MGVGPVTLIHLHGLGDIDFSSMTPDDLAEIERIAQAEDYHVVPTIFLARDYLQSFREVLRHYTEEDAAHFPRIEGFAIEGPMLGTHGGVPPAGCWVPSADEWRAISALGDLGLLYVVIGPDAVALDEEVDDELTFRAVVDLFYSHGVKLALGHFQHDDPELSAQRTRAVIEYVQSNYGPDPGCIITDHLFNDMPRNFTHAWRTPEERTRREDEIGRFLSLCWTSDTLDEILGPVPAVLVRAAEADELIPVLNFDGEHVDIAVCRRVVDYLGVDRIAAITDHTETTSMAGEPLIEHDYSSLKYRGDGVVAAGSSGPNAQSANMRGLGLTEEDIHRLMHVVPQRVLSRPKAV